MPGYKKRKPLKSSIDYYKTISKTEKLQQKDAQNQELNKVQIKTEKSKVVPPL